MNEKNKSKKFLSVLTQAAMVNGIPCEELFVDQRTS